ncbi:hypothetical protein T552_03482 [Pneumocystis carinii B80]|uniref:Uncharacterized protein n=1 Tax=Pneumocystis carinii (strain B80) TaxID=1408658 RepID=A0A0W4ZB37_PNEC8|nr:hypothetical protein T552_03482 [Pneumocystis carinii B80]KTW25622.1 hypothetical protein T552_03482 [Pneumocystis carinii B80]
MELSCTDDIERVRGLVETLVEQLRVNQEAISVLKYQVKILKDQLITIGPSGRNLKEPLSEIKVEEYARLIEEHQKLKQENESLNMLLDMYENGLNEVLLKMRGFMQDTAKKTLEIHKNYQEQLSKQFQTQQQYQKSYLDLKANLYQINDLIRQAYISESLSESEALEALEIENKGLREMFELNEELE